MRTEMHQQAFPDEDISDRAEPETVVPALLRLLDERPPSGRYRASELARRRAPVSSVSSGAAHAGHTGRPSCRALSHRAARGARDCARRRAAAGRRRRRGCRTPGSPTSPASCRRATCVVVNTSATVAAAVDGRRGRRPVTVHFATELPDGTWVVELRPAGGRDGPVTDVRTGEVRGPARRPAAVLVEPYPADRDGERAADLARPGWSSAGRVLAYLDASTGARSPTRTCRTTGRSRATRPSSPASRAAPRCRVPARPFSTELVTDLVASGVAVAPVTLHTGVSSPESGEPPLPERFGVPAATAAAGQRDAGGRRARGGRGHDGDPRAGDGGRAGRDRPARLRLDRARARPAPAGPGRRRAGHRAGTRRARRTCCCSRRSPGRTWSGGAYAAASRAGLPLARVR